MGVKLVVDLWRIISQVKNMVGVAQLVEHPVVVRDVAGSSPVAHPTMFIP